MKIVTLTVNPTIDINSAVDRVVPEWKLRCDPPSFEPGGGGINVSRAVRKLGGDSLALYAAGGFPGALLRELLDGEGLRHKAYEIKGPTREGLSILEKTTGLQYRFNMPGPVMNAEEWSGCLSWTVQNLEEGDLLVASGGLPPGVPEDFYATLAETSKAKGVRMVLDTSGPALREALGHGLFLIKPNLREFAELTGQVREDEAQEARRAEELVAQGACQILVISLGAGGVMAVSAAGVDRVPAPVVPIKSKIGAGDSTVAGMVLALARGRPWPEALRFGVAAGASAVMTPGTELCRREDTERLFEQIMLKNPPRPIPDSDHE